jgi:heme exporter protein D
MDDIGFIFASWAISLGSILVLAVVTIRRARRLAQRVPDDAKPWL